MSRYRKQKIQVVVVGAVRHNGKYLLTKRYEPRTPLTHNTWQLPGGGLEYNETVKEALLREIREETGLDVEITSPAIVCDNIVNKWKWHGVTITYVCKSKSDDLQIKLDDEATEFTWATYEEALKLNLHFGTEDILQEAEKF